MSMVPARVCGAIFGALLLILVQPAVATNKYFDCVTGSLRTSGCWVPSGIPGATDYAMIGHSSFANDVTATLTTLSFAPQYEAIAHSGHNATVNHSGGTNGSTSATYFIWIGYGAGLTGTYNLSGTGALNTGNTLVIGEYGTGILNQTGGTNTVPTDMIMGNQAGSQGTYNLSAGTLDTTTGFSPDEIIGYYGSADFNQSGGTHSAAWITLGVAGTGDGTYSLTGGTLNAGNISGSGGKGHFIQSGGTANIVELRVLSTNEFKVTLNGTANLTTAFEYLGGSGTNVIEQSAGTHTVSLQTYLGIGGSGTINLTGGANDVANLQFGYYAGDSGTYNLRGGNLTVATNISQGAGTGTLNIDGGVLSVGAGNGSITVDKLVIGSGTGLTGTHTLAGTGSIAAVTETIGDSGTGTFTQTGGTHTVAGTMTLAANAGSSGTYHLQGGSLTAALLANDGTFNFSGGTLNADIDNTGDLNLSGAGTRTLGGDLINNGEVDVASGTTARFDGFVSGAGDFTGAGTKVFSGEFSPGNSPAAVDIAGDVVFESDNTLVMELAGTTPGADYDVLNIAGEAFLNGILEISLLGGFEPPAHHSFDLLFAEVIHGNFSSIVLPGLDPGEFWQVELLLNPTGVDILRVQVIPVPAAAWMFMGGLAALGWMRRKAR